MTKIFSAFAVAIPQPTPPHRRDPLDPAPAPQFVRWTAPRKAEVVRAVQQGELSLAEASSHYRLSIEEFRTWEQGIDAYGTLGLRAKRLLASRLHPKPEDNSHRS